MSPNLPDGHRQEKQYTDTLRYRFEHQRRREGVYTPGEIDRKWSEEIEADFAKWRADQK